jgi:PAS domain S-box-containing protein
MLSPDLVRSVLDSAPDAMAVIDGSGTIVFANHQAATLFGYAPEELIGQSVERLMPGRFAERHIAHRRHYAENPRARPMGTGLDLVACHQDGTEFPAEISLSPVRDGQRLLVAAAIRDITDRKRMEGAAKDALTKADRANQAKSRFLATASHDLRQPLQTLGLLNGTMRRVVADPDLLAMLAQEEQAIGAMSRLLNTLLDISKLESGAIEPQIEDFEVAPLFEELRAEFAGLASSKGLAFRIDPGTACAHSDPSLVGQVLRNLVSNAIKYTQRGFVEVRGRRDGDVVRIEVRDSGIGIPADQLSHIYDEFYQVSVPANRTREGYGLGLSIVQRVVKLLDLGIEVTSRLGEGSSFSVSLPAGTAGAAQRERPVRQHDAADTGSRAQRRVLLIEDDPGVRNATRMLLKVAGYHVVAAGSLTEAVERAAETDGLDLIVTDYHLEGTETGLQAIAAVRNRLGRELPAILVTGDTSPAVRDLPCVGKLRTVSKPIHADELLLLITSIVA